MNKDTMHFINLSNIIIWNEMECNKKVNKKWRSQAQDLFYNPR